MKKLTLVLLVIASLILGAFVLASCEMPDEIAGIEIPDLPFINKECEHNFVEDAITKEATCTEDGAKTLKCSLCGETKEEVVPALGHDFSTKYTVDVAETCTAEGSKSKHCTRCDAKESVTVIEMAEHSWADTPTIDIPATCQDNGQMSIHCEDCGAVKDGTVEVIYAGDHVWSLGYTIDTPKTCTTEGWESIHCQNCTETKDGRVIPPSHEWEKEYTADILFGCTTDGTESIHCADCSETKDSRTVAAHHVFGDDAEITKLPSLYATGQMVGTCAVCGNDLKEVLPKTEVYVISNANKDNIPVGTLAGINWFWKIDIASLTTDTKKLYPTEADPDGNAVIAEFSALTSEKFERIGGDSVAFYMMNGATHTGLGSLDAYHDDFDDAAGIWVRSQTQTGMLPEIPKGGKQEAYRLEAGWHRIGLKLKQVVIAKDEEGVELELVAGQLAHPETDTIASITYKWICEFYVDGVLVRTGFYEGIATEAAKPGIYDESNLLYTAVIADEGKRLAYVDCTSKAALNIRLDNVITNGCYEELPIADLISSCGDDFVREVTPVTADFNGGSPIYNYEIEGSDYLYPNMCYYQVVGAVANPEFKAKKAGAVFVGWVDGVAQYSVR